MSRFQFPLPDIGEGVAEGEVVEWKVKEGDVVREDDVLCEVMTDKATVEIPCPVPGTVTKLRAAEGEVVAVGAYILDIEPAEGAHIPTITRHGDHDDEDDGEDEPAASAGTVTANTTGTATSTASGAALAELETQRPEGRRALATPYTRRLARTAGVDIERIKGSGEIGRVTPGDVERYVAALNGGGGAAAAVAPPVVPDLPALPEIPAVTAAAPVPAHEGPVETRVPIKGMRKRISDRMRLSKSMAAHFTYVDEVDVTELVRIRRDMKPLAAEQGVKLTYMPFIMKAVSSGLRRFPTLNGVTDDARGEFVIKHVQNIGVAVDTENGLIVPVVKQAGRRSLLDLAREVKRVADDARAGKSKLPDLKDGTFTITNAGNIGGLLATPVINYPEAAILGVHAIKKKPWVVDGEIVIRDIMYLSISIDHRMNDGATGAHIHEPRGGSPDQPAPAAAGRVDGRGAHAVRPRGRGGPRRGDGCRRGSRCARGGGRRPFWRRCERRNRRRARQRRRRDAPSNPVQSNLSRRPSRRRQALNETAEQSNRTAQQRSRRGRFRPTWTCSASCATTAPPTPSSPRDSPTPTRSRSTRRCAWSASSTRAACGCSARDASRSTARRWARRPRPSAARGACSPTTGSSPRCGRAARR